MDILRFGKEMKQKVKIKLFGFLNKTSAPQYGYPMIEISSHALSKLPKGGGGIRRWAGGSWSRACFLSTVTDPGQYDGITPAV